MVNISNLAPVRIEVHMPHRLLHAEPALVESLAVSVDHVNKPDWSNVEIRASDWLNVKRDTFDWSNELVPLWHKSATNLASPASSRTSVGIPWMR